MITLQAVVRCEHEDENGNQCPRNFIDEELTLEAVSRLRPQGIHRSVFQVALAEGFVDVAPMVKLRDRWERKQFGGRCEPRAMGHFCPAHAPLYPKPFT